jgi:hypothetical protein
MSWNMQDARVEQQLREANAQLQGVNDHLWELNQPPEVRAALQARRAEQARAKTWAIGVVCALAATWVLLSLAFGPAGSRLFGRLLALAWQAIEVALLLGFFVGIGLAVWRGVRWLTGRSGAAR